MWNFSWSFWHLSLDSASFSWAHRRFSELNSDSRNLRKSSCPAGSFKASSREKPHFFTRCWLGSLLGKSGKNTQLKHVHEACLKGSKPRSRKWFQAFISFLILKSWWQKWLNKQLVAQTGSQVLVLELKLLCDVSELRLMSFYLQMTAAFIEINKSFHCFKHVVVVHPELQVAGAHPKFRHVMSHSRNVRKDMGYGLTPLQCRWLVAARVYFTFPAVQQCVTPVARWWREPYLCCTAVRRPRLPLPYLASRSQSEGSSLIHGLDSSGVVTNGSYSMYCSV